MTDSYTLENEIGNDFLLDDIPDLPGYVTLFSGSYILTLEKGIEERTIESGGEKKNYYSTEFTVKLVDEIAEKIAEGESEPKVGDKTSFLFDRTHLVGMSNFKQFIAMPIARQFGLKTVGEVIEQSKGLDFIVIGKRTLSKKSTKEEPIWNFNIKKTELA